jgi:LmbE family N-acetylglucosaminyl deacetylase
MMKRVVLAVVAVGVLALAVPRAQLRVVPVDDVQGHVALGLVLRHLNNTGIFMMATAHPDDESNGLLVMLNRGQGYRTALATATRGNGGQNEIGPEIFEALGVLRTEELAAIHRFDGAEQYFTRAVDFGFSFSVDETFEKWGRDEILGDYVRLIRTIRPDVVTGLTPTGGGGGQHHQASAILAREAFKAAADPNKYPEQIKEGLRAWQPQKFYFTVGFAGSREGATQASKQLTINLTGYDHLLGHTYAEVGAEARSMHKCQGMPQLLALPGPSSISYDLVESLVPANPKQPQETALFDGIDTSIAGLARFAGAKPPKELTQGLAAIASAVQLAQRRFDTENDDATVLPLLTGLRAVRTLRSQLAAIPLDENGRFEIRTRLIQKEREFQQAILAADSIRIEALADDGVVVPGQPVAVSLIVANRGTSDVTVKQVKFEGFQGDANCTLTAPAAGGGGRGRGNVAPAGPPLSTLHRDQVAQCTTTMTVPVNTRVSEPYWHRAGEAGRYTFDADAPFGLPYRPTPFFVQVTFGFAGNEDVFGGLDVLHRYQGDIFGGEKRSDLLVVPAASVRVDPEIAIIPSSSIAATTTSTATNGATGRGSTVARGATPATGSTPARGAAPAAAPTAARGATPTTAAGRGRGAAAVAPPPPPSPQASREIRVAVVNDLKGAAEGTLHLELPQGWTAQPPEQALKFSREDESQTVRFDVRPPANVALGEYHVKAIMSENGVDFTRGYQVIEYPHIRRQHIYHATDVTLKVIDVKAAPNLTVGYIVGVGDEVPPAMAQLGAKVEMISSDDLAWGNLSRFATIVTGVRAYERRDDLRANNARLLDYVRDGGTLIVQYNKFEFNDAQYGPYPAKVSSDRVTDEFAPVKLLVPADPVFNAPNKITDATWKNWVQERGLYFLGDHDSRYRELLSIDEPFPYNKGEKLGSLVSAQWGKGRWVYVGLGLWRELPAGVDGAYQLLANLISLGHTS